ncbi:MAG: hypothetical protein ACXVII_28280 [Solirubrobacteraceae bacterium]
MRAVGADHGAGVRGRPSDWFVDARVAQAGLRELDRLTGWLKGLGFVKWGGQQPVNGFGDLILALRGDAGRQVRLAIGAGELPFGMPVEVEAIVAIA